MTQRQAKSAWHTANCESREYFTPSYIFFLSEISSSQVSRSRKLVQSSSNPAGILATAIVHLWQATKAKKSLKLNLC